MAYEEVHFIYSVVGRLLLAAVLGAVVGLERETHHKPAGLRTIMFMTFGSALFTVVSEVLGKIHGGDPQRIAAQLIPGIGFIGAGSIIQSRGSVVGLTTAATIFVMASIGMACGGGLYLIAVFSTAVLLSALFFLGWLEQRMGWKAPVIAYHLSTRHPDQTIGELSQLLEKEGLAMQHIQCHAADGLFTMEFTVPVPERSQERLAGLLRELPGVKAAGYSERGD